MTSSAPTGPPAAQARTPLAQPIAQPRPPSPFDLDRAKKAAQPEPRGSGDTSAPASDAEWKERLHSMLIEIGMMFTADAVEHSTLAVSAGELQFTTPEEFMLGMKPDDLNQAIRRIVGRPMKIKIAPGQAAAPTAPVRTQKAPADETSSRALNNPEVKRFQEVFGGQIRTVRNLKE